MFPEDFIKRIRTQDYIDPEDLIKAMTGPSPVSIRTNPVKWNMVPENSRHVSWCANGFYLEKRPSFTLDPLFHSGCYYPQEASGMFIEQVFRQMTGSAKGIKVLDLCGAPGGKSTHLSSMIGDDGFIVANDVIRSRAHILAGNLTKWGLSNAIVTQSDPSSFSNLPGFFDVILVDAPCSGEGMFRDRIAVEEWSVENAALCSERQKRILIDSWPALKTNGILIYSTCTFNPDENEKNIKWLTENRKAEPVRLDISDFRDIKEIDYDGIYGYGFHPGKVRGEGLFISVLLKKEETPAVRTGKVRHTERKPDNNDINAASDFSHFQDASLIRAGDDLFSIPCSKSDYQILSKYLKILKPGTLICSVKGRNYIPSYELALSVFLRKSVFNTLNFDLEEALNYLKRGSITRSVEAKGWNLVSYQGINLGFLKNIGSRLNNYYPVDWRIRMSSYDKSGPNIIKWIQPNG